MPEKKWKISDVGKVLKSSAIAIVRGELLMKLDIGRYFIHILYCFLLMAMAIWISLGIDATMTKVETNKQILVDQEVEIAMKTYQVNALERRSGIEIRLGDMGSKVKEPQQPAIQLEK